MLRDLITNEEYEMMDWYRKNYCCSDYDHNNFVGSRDFLEFWEENKSIYLSKLFDGNLQVEIPICIDTPRDSKIKEMERDELYCDSTWSKLYDYMIPGEDKYRERSYPYRRLLTFANVADKKLPGVTSAGDFSFSGGTKLTHALRKINKEYKVVSDEELENLFTKFSMYHNKKLKGTYVLSIHPLDYMTMSDNFSKWGSCMSWIDNGCYKSGTVEMMNSKSVVVGYLKSDSNDFTFGPYNNRYHWNNKKWRTLFVIDPSFAVSIKGYPYQSKELALIGLDWFKNHLGLNSELIDFEENDDFRLIRLDPDKEGPVDDNYIHFTTDSMYNDFGSAIHYGYRYEGEFVDEDWDNYSRYFNYSGYRQCVICGETHTDFYRSEGDEGQLVGECCTTHYCCDECGNYCNEEDLTEVNGRMICSCCFNDYYREDPLRPGEYFYYEDGERVYFAKHGEDGKILISPIYFLSYFTDYADDFFKTGVHSFREYEDEVDTSATTFVDRWDKFVFIDETDESLEKFLNDNFEGITEASFFEQLFVGF